MLPSSMRDLEYGVLLLLFLPCCPGVQWLLFCFVRAATSEVSERTE